MDQTWSEASSVTMRGDIPRADRGTYMKRKRQESGSSAIEGNASQAERSEVDVGPRWKAANQIFEDFKTELDRQICHDRAKVAELQKTVAKQNADAINDRSEIEILEEEKDHAEEELYRQRDINEKLEERLARSEKIAGAARAVVRASWKEFGARMDELTEAVKHDQ